MRIFAFLVLSLLAGLSCHAQVPAGDAVPDVQVLEYSWAKERIAWERDPFSVPNETYTEMRERVRTERRPKSALEERAIKDNKAERTPTTKPPRYAFKYHLTIRNTGDRTIKEIDWDYIFTDSVTGEELGRREFTSMEKLSPGKKKQLLMHVSSPPTQLISVHALGSNERQGLIEKVTILRVLYEDGSVWTP